MWETLKAALKRYENAVANYFAGDHSGEHVSAQASVNDAINAHLAAIDARLSKLEGAEASSAPDPAASNALAAVDAAIENAKQE